MILDDLIIKIEEQSPLLPDERELIIEALAYYKEVYI
jgi:hypothetical protein